MKPFAAPTSRTFTSSRHARHHWEAGPVDELLMVFLHGLPALALGPATARTWRRSSIAGRGSHHANGLRR